VRRTPKENEDLGAAGHLVEIHGGRHLLQQNWRRKRGPFTPRDTANCFAESLLPNNYRGSRCEQPGLT